MLRYISLAVFLVLPALATAQPKPEASEVQQSYETMISDLARMNVGLNAQILADKREIAKLQAAANAPQKKAPPTP